MGKKKKLKQFSGKKEIVVKKVTQFGSTLEFTESRVITNSDLYAAQTEFENQFNLDSMFELHSNASSAAFANVVGHAIGRKEVEGTPTDIEAVRVYVREKLSKSKIGKDLIPDSIEGVPTDVIEIGNVYPLASGFRSKTRPAKCGSSCGHPRVNAGTIGALCLRGNDLFMLSNNHVLADVNSAERGDTIVQPSPADGGLHRNNIIAELAHWIDIDFGAENQVDAALAFTAFKYVSPCHETFTMHPKTQAPKKDLTVIKNGRTTGLRVGLVSGINASLPINYGTQFRPKYARFIGQIEITGINKRFSAGGDSGSLVVGQKSKKPVGLLFAGNRYYSWANPIKTVMKLLKIDKLISKVID